MTRDSQRLVEEQDGDTEVLSALWRAAPSFPQVPPDAPPELKALVVDIEDPKKVYTIYRASRRHGFQLLVERYINQLRYGCQDPRCNTSTCFTCRRRSAVATPVRRYNATSARTLACFLASQDNPEKGLCQYAGVPQSKAPTHTRLRVSSKSSISANSTKSFQWGARSPKTPTHNLSGGAGSGETSPTGFEGTSSSARHTRSRITRDEISTNEKITDMEHVRSVVQALEEPMKKDPKSFIQNLFGTVAFRMLEWLTPKNIESMISPDACTQETPPRKSAPKIDDLCKPKVPPAPHSGNVEESTASKAPCRGSQTAGEGKPKPKSSPDSVAHLPCGLDGHVDASGRHNEDEATKQAPDAATKCSRDLRDTTPETLSANYLNESLSHDGQDRKPLELGTSKSAHMNGQIQQVEEHENRRIIETHRPLTPKKVRKRPTSSTGSRPPMSYDQSFPHQSGPQSLTPENARCASVSKVLPSRSYGDAKQVEPEEPHDILLQQKQHPSSFQPSIATAKVYPQALSVLSLEVIDFISNISNENRWRDSKMAFTAPPYPKEGLRRARKFEKSGNAEAGGQFLTHPLPLGTPVWKSFIEQSLFYVLSSPKALLQSFSEDGQSSLIDTQTMWYCMMRLIHTNSSLVIDSLWIAAADLYIPPRELWPIYDWAKKPRIDEAGVNVDYTLDEAARLMSICLHALIAAVPYTGDAAQLFAMSRIRSHGVSSIQRGGVSAESVNLYLIIDDVFSDELNLRLARRLFAAIPARRQYQDILRLDETTIAGRSSIPDILELVLTPLNFLDIEVPRILDFTAQDRELHEKRTPTLMIDWARTVMLQDWAGRAEVSADGAFGGALTMMSAIYERRKSLLLGDIHFRTEYFADRLDSMEMPVEWMSFTPNKKTLHLLDYPYLFSPANLVTYFRAINFSRMSRSFEASSSMHSRIQNTMASGTLMTDSSRREDLLDRLRTAVSKFLVLQIRRSDVLADAFNHLWRRELRELLRPLKIRLGEDSGEEGSDSGGVQQEFFRLAIAEALNPDYGAFTIDERTRMIWFQPGSPQPPWKFELIGLIISLAVYNGLTLPVTFPKALYRKLLGAAVTELYHIEDGWPDLASGLTTLLEWDEKDGPVSDVFSRTYEFSIESPFGKQISRDMSASTQWPQFHEPAGPNPVNARLVDSENRNEYVSDYILWLTDISMRPQFEAFRRGFFTCLDRRSLALFDPDILQSVVEGVQEIDISELRRYTRYVGWDATHRTIKDFWSIVKKFDSDEKKKLLEFVTASDRVPVGGMRNLQFVIQRNGVGDIDGHLPTSYTCYGTLLLPEYSSKETLKEKLGMALENAKGFGFA